MAKTKATKKSTAKAKSGAKLKAKAKTSVVKAKKTAKPAKKVAKKTVVKKPALKKTAPKKVVGKKITAKKTIVKKAAVKVVKKAVAKKVAVKKAVVKKAVVKVAPVKKVVVEKVAPKQVVAPKGPYGLPEQLRDAALKVLDERQADDIVNVDLRGRSAIADYALVASGRASKQLGAIAHYLREAFAKLGVTQIRTEGLQEGNWVLVDAGDIIVHLFRPEVRRYYNIEQIWSRTGREEAAETDEEFEEENDIT